MKEMLFSKITILAYLVFLFHGVNTNIGGVAIVDIAKTFGVDTYIIGYIFACNSVGFTISTFVGAWLVKRVSTRRLGIGSVFLVILGYLGIVFGGRLFTYGASIFTVGLGVGMLFYLANYYIVNLYEGKYRTMQLNALNFFFSFGAVVSPIVAGILIKNQVAWEQVYQLAMLVLVPLLLMTVVAKFEGKKKERAVQASDGKEPWNINVYLIGAVFVFYALSEVVFSNWIVVYLREALKVDVAVASSALSFFWTFMAIGRLASGMITAVVRVEKFIIASAVLALSSYIAVLSLDTVSFIFIFIALMGLGYSGMYASIFSYGTMQLRHPSPSLMTFYMTLSSLGGILCYLASSFVVQEFGLYTCLRASAASMGVVGLLIITCIVLGKRQRHQSLV